jgi:DNA-binding transcriptional MerR regulator
MLPADKNPSVGIRPAAELSGLTVHMVVYLSRTGILIPAGGTSPGRGRRRLYTFNDVIFLKVIADLLARGIEVKRLTKSLQRARAESAAWIDIRRAPSRILVTDGTEVFVHRRGRLESKTFNGQLAFAFVIDLARPHEAIARSWPVTHAAAG